MKHIFLLISFFISLNMFAIDPQKGFNYQAVLRDASGMVIKEQSVTLQVTIMSDNQVAYCLLYTSPSPRDKRQSRMPSSA